MRHDISDFRTIMRNPLFWLALYCLLVLSVDARTRCVRISGQFECPTDPDRQYNVKVELMDKDRKCALGSFSGRKLGEEERLLLR